MDAKKQYNRLLTDLLGVLDAVDQACAHWQEVEAEMQDSALTGQETLQDTDAEEGANTGEATSLPALNPIQQLGKSVLDQLGALIGLSVEPATHPQESDGDATEQGQSQPASEDLAEVIASGREGAELIQRSLLDALRQQKITPIDAIGKPFNAKLMFAIDRQSDATVPPNTVLEEIVRGYQQGDQVLREAQVIVSSNR